MKRTHAQMEARERPKRVVNSFVLFVQDVKANATDNAPTSRPELKKMWEEISDEKKAEIERQHARLMMSWQRDMASYVEEFPEDSDDEGDEDVAVAAKPTKKKKAPRDPNKPRRYQNAYFHFQNEKRKEMKAKNPGIGGREVQSHVSELWKAMSDDDKKPYQALEAEEKEQYEKDMEKYNAGLAAVGGIDGVASALVSVAKATSTLAAQTKKIEEKVNRKKKAGEPKETKKKIAEKPKPRRIEEDVEMGEADDSSDDEMAGDESHDDLGESDGEEEEDASEEIGSEDEEDEEDEEDDDEESEEDSEEAAVIVESGSDEESSEEDDDSDSDDGVAVTFS